MRVLILELQVRVIDDLACQVRGGTIIAYICLVQQEQQWDLGCCIQFVVCCLHWF
jgi:hypothetical protein